MKSILLSWIHLSLLLYKGVTSSNTNTNTSAEHVHIKTTITTTYGVDVSIPVHRPQVSTNYAWLPHNQKSNLLNTTANATTTHNIVPDPYKDMPIQYLGDKQSFYEDYMRKWKRSLEDAGEDPNDADWLEQDRILGNLQQPAIVMNFTETGYTKVKAPEELRKILTQFWNDNRDKQQEEDYLAILNQFDNPTTIIRVEDESMTGGGSELMKSIWDATRNEVSKWTNGLDLVGSSLYGIRIYKRGSILLPHVDRLPLVCSAIINVAQDVEEPWPLEVYGRDGMAVNITMEPGDMVLYESHSLIHGRPFPLQGDFFANIFVHFEPRHAPLEDGQIPSYMKQDISPELLQTYYTDVVAEFQTISESNLFDEEEKEKDTQVVNYEQEENDFDEDHDEHIGIHLAASLGDMEALQYFMEEEEYDIDDINAKDGNNWTPLAYAVYNGHYHAVQYLVEHGAFVTEELDSLETPITIAEELADERNRIVNYLKSIQESYEDEDEWEEL